jgi:electron transport complex protein RnfB
MTAEEIDTLLPQTQCTRCGYAGCLPYAQAIVRGDAQINQCPPGGAATISALAAALGREALALNPINGVEGPALVAQIDEARCIGCIKCLAPCPVDAILGAKKLTHTVITELCTGCELCVAPCPVDCIVMLPRSAVSDASSAPDATANRYRFAAHVGRLAQREAEQAALLAEKKRAASAP